jgi:hypothetical protein
MPIYFDKSAPGVVSAAARRLRSRESERLRGFISELRIAPPVAVYAVVRDDDLEQLRPSDVKRIAWRCFVLSGEEAVAAADVTLHSGARLVTRLAAGKTVHRTVDAIAAAEEEAGPRQVRVRLLVVPWLFFNAVWMSSEGRHRLLPIDAPGTTLRRQLAESNGSHDWGTVRDALSNFSRARALAARPMRTLDTAQ